MKAPVNKIINFSNVDGPGNRTSIFFQQCNFKCKFCHNPETINMCIHCGKCVKGCPVGALQMIDGKVVWNSEKCVSCDKCIATCENYASPKIKEMTPSDIIRHLKTTKPYIKGITTSGGECSLRAAFLKQLFPRVQKMGLTTFMDSNGSYDYQKDPELLECVDAVMLDVKASDSQFHQYLCGYDNTIVLKNLDFLLAQGKLYEVRTIIFPGRDKQNQQTVEYVASRIKDQCIYKLIKYRPFGVKEAYQKELGEIGTDDQYAQQFLALALKNGAKKAVII